MVDVKKLGTFKIFSMSSLRFLACARDPLWRFVWSRLKNYGLFTICSMRARDPLRRFAWSRFKNSGLFTISASRARPSAEIRVVEVQKTADFLRFLQAARDPRRRFAWSRFKKLGTFYDFCKPRATLCGARACRSALAVAPCVFVAREVAFGSCLVARAPALAIPRSRVRFLPGPRQLRLENRSF